MDNVDSRYRWAPAQLQVDADAWVRSVRQTRTRPARPLLVRVAAGAVAAVAAGAVFYTGVVG